MTLQDSLPGFTVEQKLENTGEKPIHQYYYDHNFTNVDDLPPGPAWRLELPFTPTALNPLGTKAAIDGNTVRILRPITDKALFTVLTGFGSTASDNHFTLWNDEIGQGLEVTVDKPLVNFAYFAAKCAVCPEPFININIAPGEEFIWKTDYAIRSV
jgi:hypothetical protein